MPLWRTALLFLFVLLAVMLAGNLRSLAEGTRYLHQWQTWRPGDVTPIAPDGPYGICYDLVALDNQGRYGRLRDEVRALGLDPTEVPLPSVPEAPPDLFLPLADDGPYTLLVAHYDKSRETASYQGASDNTAAVAALLAVLKELAAAPEGALARPVALLWTSGEEQGALGAQAFVEWALAEGVPLGEVLVLDMLGRGRLASRPMADPGFYFWLPVAGQMVYDGRSLHPGSPYAQSDPQLLARLKRIMGEDLVIYRRFTAYGDANVFQRVGLPVVSLSSANIYYLDLVWERDADRIELLDEGHLSLTRDLLLRYVRSPLSGVAGSADADRRF